MEATDLYKKILGIESPWFISTIDVCEKSRQVTIELAHEVGTKFCCSVCGEQRRVHDHQKSRTWRHLDTCQYETHLKASIPRLKCGTCGVHTALIPWAQPHSRFSELFECHAIDILQSCQVLERSAMQLRITPDQLNYLMKKSVERGLSLRQKAAIPIKKLAIDEKSLQTGHHYVTILSDADEGKVLEVSADRTLESVQKVYKALTDNQLGAVRSVTMDMWSAFETGTKQAVPQADTVHDRFHLSGYLNNAVDITRRAENKKLLKNDDKSLQNTKYLWLKNPKNFTPKDIERLQEIIENNKTPHLIEIYQLKEEFKTFFECPDTETATLFFKQWQEKVIKTNNTQLVKVAKMFEKHFTGILNYISHHVTNAIAEGLNSRIQQLKAKARGFKSAAAFRVAILFHFGKLYLYPK